jgi:hypothetical protein
MKSVARFGRDDAGLAIRQALQAMALVGVLVIQVGCGGPSSRQSWEAALGQCGALPTSGLGYLGPTDHVGPGAVWRSLPRKGFALTRSSDRAPLPGQVVVEGEWFVCPEGGSPVRWSNVSGALLTQIGGVAGDLASTFDRASHVSFSVDGWRELRLDEGAFVTWVDGLPEDDAYRRALRRNERVVAWRVIQARGLVADVSFEAPDAERLRTTLVSGTTTMSGRAGMGTPLDLEWIAPSVLRVSSRADFFVFTGLAFYAPPATGSERGVLVSVPVPFDGPMVYELLDEGAGAAD